jgi:hypothetical protein
LVHALQQLVHTSVNSASRSHVSSGWKELDRLLPEQGLRRGSLLECFVEPAGAGGGTLALRIAGAVCQPEGHLVVVDSHASFYPPAAAAWGIELRHLILVRPKKTADALWALDQALRCPAVKAVWSCCGALNDRWFRRFQLAAEHSGCLGIFVRPARYIGQPSWSDIQLRITPAAGITPPEESELRLRVELIRCRGQSSLGSVVLMLGSER